MPHSLVVTLFLIRGHTMHAEEAQANAGSGPGPSPPTESAGPTPSRTMPAGVADHLPTWLLTVGAGLLAGLISWAGGEATFDTFKLEDHIVYPPDYKQISGYQKLAVQSNIEGVARVVVERKKAAVAFGLLGLILG